MTRQQMTKKIRFTGMLAIIFLVAGLQAGCGLIYDEEKTLASAAEHQKKGDHQTAVIEYKKVLQKNPESKAARESIASSYIALKQGAAAEKELRRAIKLGADKNKLIVNLATALLLQNKIDEVFTETPISPALPEATKAELYLTHGYAYFSGRKMDKAQEMFNKASGYKSVEVSAYIGLSKLAATKADFKEGLEEIARALNLDNKNGEAWFQRGRINMSMGDMDEAKRSFGNVVNVSPKTMMSNLEFQARVKLSQIGLSEQNFAAAKEQVAVMSKHAPNNHMTRYMTAMIAFQEKDYETARGHLEQVSANMPDFLQAQLLMGAIYFAQGHLEQAEEVLSRYVTKVPSHLQARKLLASVRVKSGRHKDALDTLKQVQNPEQDAELLAMIGRVSILSNDPKRGVNYLKQASQSDPKNQMLREELAKVYMREGSVDDAIKELNAMSGDAKTELKKQVLLIQAHLRKQDFKTARALVKELLKKNKPSPEGYALAGFVELLAGDRVAARKLYNSGLELNNDHIPSLLTLARIELEDSNLAEAEARFSRILQIQPNNIKAMMGMADLSGRRNKPEEAINWLEQAIAKNNKAVEPRLILSRYFMSIKNPAKAIVLLEDAMKHKPNNKAVLHMLAQARLGTGQNEAALLLAKKIIQKWPNEPNSHIALAQIQEKLNYRQKAIRSLEKANSLDKKFVPAKIMLTSLYIKNRDYKRADKIISEIKSMAPKNAVGYMLEGEKWLAMKKFANAGKAFSQAMKKQQSVDVARKLSVSLLLSGDNNKAISVLENWLKKKPDDDLVRFDLANAYERSGKTDKAIAEYSTILKKSPDNIAVLNNLAFINLSRDKNKALEYAERAYKLRTNVPEIADTYGWVLYKTGKPDEALPILARAAAKSKHPSIQYHYAVVLENKGEKAKAKLVLDKALSNNVDFDEKKAAVALQNKVSR